MLFNSGRLSFLIFLFLLSACHSEKLGKLRRENDSLRNQLESQHSAMTTMIGARKWLDSIDANRNLLPTHLEEEIGYPEFSSRVEDINEFVKRSQKKLAIIEKSLESSKTRSSEHLMLVDEMKKELDLRVHNVVQLHGQLGSYKNDNSRLHATLNVKENDAEATLNYLSKQHEQLLALEAKMQMMINAFKVAEADAYYARARAMEETAKRTRFSRPKKRASLDEALELYKKSLSLGKKEASADIAKLEKMMK